MSEGIRAGRCLCGAVRYTVTGAVEPVVACHCSQCRRQSGHFWCSIDAPMDAIALEGAEHVTWYRASPRAARGFCRVCGSFLFWKPEGEARMAIGAGSLDTPTGLSIGRHIFCADKGDYYEIEGDAPRSAGGSA